MKSPQEDTFGGASSAVSSSVSREGEFLLKGACVLVLSHGFQPNYERGFTNGIAHNGARVLLVSSDRTEMANLDAAITVRNLRGSQDPSRSRLRKAVNLLRYHAGVSWLVLRHSRWQVHVVGMLDPVWWCGIVQGLWFRLLSRRYVLTVHNLVPHDAHTQLNRLLFGVAYRLPHALVVHTLAMKQQLVGTYSLPAERIHLMEHGIDSMQASLACGPELRRSGPLNLLFFGSLMRYKGLDLLLEALKLDVPAFRLRIAGPCVDISLAKEVEASISGHPRRIDISWSEGFVAEGDVPELFEWADALVLPYRHIDQSGVLFQALRHGLPVIATDVGSLKNYVDAAVGLICAVGSPAALAQALREFQFRRATFSRVEIQERAQGFDWDTVTKSLSNAYACNFEDAGPGW